MTYDEIYHQAVTESIARRQNYLHLPLITCGCMLGKPLIRIWCIAG